MVHIGVGLAAKRIAPKINVGLLILAAEFIEVIFIVLWALGIENIPSDELASYSPYSHSLVMGVFWTLVASLFVFWRTRKHTTTLLIGALVFSHTILDLIASPRTAFFANDTGMPIFLNPSITVGLGLWRFETLALSLEYGSVVAGLVVYWFARKRFKQAVPMS